jgi:hypothetical protein
MVLANSTTTGQELGFCEMIWPLNRKFIVKCSDPWLQFLNNVLEVLRLMLLWLASECESDFIYMHMPVIRILLSEFHILTMRQIAQYHVNKSLGWCHQIVFGVQSILVQQQQLSSVPLYNIRVSQRLNIWYTGQLPISLQCGQKFFSHVARPCSRSWQVLSLCYSEQFKELLSFLIVLHWSDSAFGGSSTYMHVVMVNLKVNTVQCPVAHNFVINSEVTLFDVVVLMFFSPAIWYVISFTLQLTLWDSGGDLYVAGMNATFPICKSEVAVVVGPVYILLLSLWEACY